MKHVQIRYCKVWNYYPRAARLAALIARETGVEADVIEGARGEFSVLVDGQVIARKDALGFPPDDDSVTKVRAALAQ